MNFYEPIERKISEAKSLEELTAGLETLLSAGVAVWTDGRLYSIRQLVGKVNNLRIEVFAREHAPPHFHVKSSDIDATFRIVDGSLLSGKVQGRELHLIQWWYQRGRGTLIDTWNKMRPTDCPVGPIEPAAKPQGTPVA